MGGVIELFFWMLIIASVAFAPLGYFIYRYTYKNGEPFGNIEPHGDSESPVLKTVEKVISAIKGKLAKK